MGGNGKSGETPRGKAVRRMMLGIDERINGVNLGNWLVLEKWMDPEPFVRTDEDDEIWMHRTHGALWSERNLAEELRRHRDAYITLEDFRIIADHGLNLVRIPIPYFIFGDWPGHPGCIAYLDRAFRWARETGLKIMIDLHTVPGSQNGFDNGGLTGVCKWAQNPDLVEYALNVLERLARRYRDEPTLHSIEVLNEPVSWSVFHGTSNTAKDVREASGSTHVPLRFLKRFYRDAYTRLRAILRPETIIVFHDGFRLLRWGDWFRRAGMRNVMLDTHQYLIAMEEPLFAGPARRLYLQSRHLPWLYRMLVGAREIAIRSAARHIPVLVGEWCVENRWALHGRNRADAYRQVSRLQRAAWDASAGQVYWSYQLARSAKPGSGEGKPPRDPRNGGNLEAWDLTRVWRHGWIQADAPHDDVASAPSINDNRRKGH